LVVFSKSFKLKLFCFNVCQHTSAIVYTKRSNLLSVIKQKIFPKRRRASVSKHQNVAAS